MSQIRDRIPSRRRSVLLETTTTTNESQGCYNAIRVTSYIECATSIVHLYDCGLIAITAITQCK